MSFSVRTRILVLYTALAATFVFALVTSVSRFNGIGARLNAIQSGYLPIVKTVNSATNFYHLDETFDVTKILRNRSNRLFINSITTANPRLLENGLRLGLDDARQALARNPTDKERRALKRVSDLVDDLLRQHRKYADLIREIAGEIDAGKVAQAQKRNPELMQQRRVVRSRLDFLSWRLDDQIRRGIRDTLEEERKAMYLSLGLLIGTLLLALLLGMWVLLSLRPLGLLKRAAQEIAAGDLRQRVTIRSRDEVGELGREFNRMADSIQERDVALRKQQEQLIASEKLAVVGRMASKISHEIRNPLNALGLNVELLEDEVKSEEARKILQSISTEINRLAHVTENYLALARTPPRVEKTDVGRILEHLDSLIRGDLTRREVRFRMDAAGPFPSLKIDAGRLEQALLNLVRNAAEAVGPGGELGIRAAAENGSLVLEVWDKGPGISSELLPRIFEPFFTTKEKGTGLGLSITQEIVREQGGTIECRSAPGEGTRFEIRLPVPA